MSTITFDTLKFSKKLVAAGFSEQQAETLAEEQAALIEDQLATKRDLKELEVTLRRDIADVKRDLTIRMGGMMVTAVVAVAALVKLL